MDDEPHNVLVSELKHLRKWFDKYPPNSHAVWFPFNPTFRQVLHEYHGYEAALSMSIASAFLKDRLDG